MIDFWNSRYNEDKYAYGILPNQFLEKELQNLKPGTLLLPAEGEGRNAVYAAKKDWKVTAFDYSNAAKIKATQLAESENVSINFYVTDVMAFSSKIQFDAIALIYAHFPSDIRRGAHQHLLQFLKPNGLIIFEAFSKEQLGKPSGGPKSLDMLFSIEEIKEEFPTIEFLTLKQEEIELTEGQYHNGPASVIRFIGRLK